jgi:type I restriction enzyme S subunit
MSQVPEDWVSTTVGGSADLLTGFPFSSAGFSDAGIRLVRGSNVKRGMLDWTKDISMYWPSDEPRFRAFQLRENDILIAMDGALVGRSHAWIRKSDLPAYLVQRVARLRGTSIAQNLLYQHIRSHRFVQWVDSVKTHTAIPHISSKDIRDFEIYIPPGFQEQDRIGEALSDVDDLIDSLDRLIAKKQHVMVATSQALLSRRRRLPGHEKGWTTSHLGEICEIVSGGTPSSSVAAYWNGDIPWCTPTDITREPGRFLRQTERTISQEGLLKSAAQIVPSGSLLLCTRATIGDVKIAGTPIATNQGFKSLVPGTDVSTEYLYYKILSLKLDLVSKGTGSTFLEVSKRDVGALPVALPPLDEQGAITEVLSDIDDEIDGLVARRDKTVMVKQAMMHELLTGKTRLV